MSDLSELFDEDSMPVASDGDSLWNDDADEEDTSETEDEDSVDDELFQELFDEYPVFEYESEYAF